MKRLMRNKRAVSPVIATVLMILVTMIGMTILFGFVTYYADSYRAGIGSQVRELLVIEDVWINPPNVPDNQVKITVYNAGKVDSEITSVYVNGLALREVTSSDFNLADKKVEVGDHLTLTLYRIEGWVGTDFAFTIGTRAGSTFDLEYTRP